MSARARVRDPAVCPVAGARHRAINRRALAADAQAYRTAAPLRGPARRRAVRRNQLGEILIDARLVDDAQLAIALAQQGQTGRPLGETLIALGYVSAEAVRDALEMQLREDRGSLASTAPDPKAVRLVSAALAREARAVPIEVRESDGVLIVAMEDPQDLLSVDRIALATNYFVQAVRLPDNDIGALIERCYPAADPAPAPDAARPAPERKRRVGEILIDAGVVDEAQLAVALAEQRRTGGQLGKILVKLGLASEEAVSRALADQSGVAHMNLDAITPTAEAIALVPEPLARRSRLAPLELDTAEGLLQIAMANPADIVAIDEIEMSTGLFVHVVQATERQISRFLDRAYGARRGAAQERTFDELIRRAVAELESGDETPTQGGIAALVDELISTGIRQEATDIHIEPDRSVTRIRYRIDGDLTHGPTLASVLLASVVARVKILSHLDISINRTPQDGKISFASDGRKVDLRVSTFPSITGESVVIRVLDTGKSQFTLDRLGLSPTEIACLRAAAQRPNGLILTVGPTGSGKTTTLYALLRSVNSGVRKVITLEDPVEYELSLITQCQINEKAGVTFASGLRAILRHDPDIILVGEMRDAETCTMAMRAALTGHLVLSTLHTNDAVRTISRLRDMDMQPYMIASCLALVCAQRLLRVACETCKEPYVPREAELAMCGLPPDAQGEFHRAPGCDRCHGTGMRGRRALYEVLPIGPEVAEGIAREVPVHELDGLARGAGLVTFRANAQRLASEGAITLAEAARISMET
jgi:type IV pilus assembly protein PilB